MPLFRVVAFVLFVIAGLAGAQWFVHATTGTILAFVAFGLAAYVLSALSVPSPPAS